MGLPAVRAARGALTHHLDPALSPCAALRHRRRPQASHPSHLHHRHRRLTLPRTKYQSSISTGGSVAAERTCCSHLWPHNTHGADHSLTRSGGDDNHRVTCTQGAAAVAYTLLSQCPCPLSISTPPEASRPKRRAHPAPALLWPGKVSVVCYFELFVILRITLHSCSRNQRNNSHTSRLVFNCTFSCT